MTDPTAQEPTMEEILASIRRIISEDDAPADAAAAPEPVAAPAPAPEPKPFPVMQEAPADTEPAPEPAPEPLAADDDVLDLTDRYEAPPAESIGDLDVFEPEAPAAWSPQPEPAPAPVAASYDSLVGESASASAASAFAGLHASLSKPAPASSGPDLSFLSGSTVEGMVAEMLRPMLKSWLDANLTSIVEEAVAKEVARISRTAG